MPRGVPSVIAACGPRARACGATSRTGARRTVPALRLVASRPPPNHDQRWERGRDVWIPPEAGRIRPAEFGVDGIREAEARAFIAAHHYAGDGLPPVRLAVGLFRKTGPAAEARLVGVAVFSQPMNQRAVPSHTGVPARGGCELGRFACAPEVLHGGESWFLPRAFRLLQAEKPEIEAVISYADPVSRQTATGALVKPGHFGTVYQALSAALTGTSAPRTLLLTPAGRVVSPRTLSKISLAERGRRYAAAQLAALGLGDPTAPGQPLAEWIDAAVVAGALRRVRHPGNIAYAFALTREARRTIAAHQPERPRYPKAAEGAEAVVGRLRLAFTAESLSLSSARC